MTTLEDRARAVRLVVLDVDGVLSDGRINISSNGELFKSFFVRDGLGIKMLQKAEAFCKDQDLIMKPVSITVVDRRTNQKTAVAVAETILSQPGNIELVFTCDRPH